MNQEYVIINKTAIEKRIEELERLYKGCEKPSIQGTLYNQLNIELKQILPKSTPFIPEIEKAYNAGKLHNELSITFDNPQGRYISNLKLNI